MMARHVMSELEALGSPKPFIREGRTPSLVDRFSGGLGQLC